MPELTRELDAFMAGLVERTDPQTAEALLCAAGADGQAGCGAGRIQQGDMAPDFSLPDQSGSAVSLSGRLAQGPVVLTFFRGGWCPFCTLALRALERIRPALRGRGASVLAISPQALAHTRETVERNRLGFSVLTDTGNEVARRYGLAWDMEPKLRAVFDRLGQPLPRINQASDWTLPVPAGFVIGRDGRVVHAHVDARINRRLEPAEVLAAVNALADAVQ